MRATLRTGGQTARQRLTWFLSLAMVACMASPLHAETYVYKTQLTTFSPRDRDEHNRTGWAPVGELVQAPDGLFSGVTAGGGANGSGVVFAYQRNDASTPIHDLYAFSALQDGNAGQAPTNADGATPTGLILGVDGFFYGTTSGGGAAGTGTIFRVSTSGVLTTLHVSVCISYFCRSRATLDALESAFAGATPAFFGEPLNEASRAELNRRAAGLGIEFFEWLQQRR